MVKAIIVATGQSDNLPILEERYPLPLLPLIDRPFLQHVVELLVEGGVTSMEFILYHLPDKIESLLGNGMRWGSNFTFHLAQSPNDISHFLPLILNEEDEFIWLIQANHLLEIPIQEIEQEKKSQLFYLPNKEQNKDSWSGWAFLSKQDLQEVPETANFEDLEKHLLAKQIEKTAIAKFLSASSCKDLYISSSKILQKEFSFPTSVVSEIEEGIWLGRNVSLHPTVRVHKPVYIGTNCKIDQGSTLGPNTVIGDGCIISSQCEVKNSLIFPKSYIGESLNLEDSVVDKNCLVNFEVDSTVAVSDHFLLGDVAENIFSKFFMRALTRSVGCILYILLLPITLLTMLILKMKRGKVKHAQEVVHLPTISPHEEQWQTFELSCFSSKDFQATKISPWQHFFLYFLPSLKHIVKGELNFVGLIPRTKDQITHLPKDWQQLYLQGKVGIITEAFVYSHEEDDIYATESFYSVSRKFWYDAKLVLKYLRNLVW